MSLPAYTLVNQNLIPYCVYLVMSTCSSIKNKVFCSKSPTFIVVTYLVYIYYNFVIINSAHLFIIVYAGLCGVLGCAETGDDGAADRGQHHLHRGLQIRRRLPEPHGLGPQVLHLHDSCTTLITWHQFMHETLGSHAKP
jgi:hypothetical protein